MARLRPRDPYQLTAEEKEIVRRYQRNRWIRADEKRKAANMKNDEAQTTDASENPAGDIFANVEKLDPQMSDAEIREVTRQVFEATSVQGVTGARKITDAYDAIIKRFGG